ncbi:MAG: hypothetical protein K9K39_01530 [Desulfohalobiaceae bacterium]|nr:hypothetical protein [Desulfohalobiaceae bacterium]
MLKRTKCFVLAAVIVLLFAVPSFSADYGIQFGGSMSTFNQYPTTLGVKIAQGNYAIIPRIGMWMVDYETNDQDDTLTALTLGGTFDYYIPQLSEEKLKPYIGGDLDISFWELDDSHTAINITPHFGVEYWLSKKFSVAGQAGVNFGVGEVLNAENRVATTSGIFVTYYF